LQADLQLFPTQFWLRLGWVGGVSYQPTAHMTWRSQRVLCSLLWSGYYYSMRGICHLRSDVLDEQCATYVFNVCGCLRRVGRAKQVGHAKRVGRSDWRVGHTDTQKKSYCDKNPLFRLIFRSLFVGAWCLQYVVLYSS